MADMQAWYNLGQELLGRPLPTRSAPSASNGIGYSRVATTEPPEEEIPQPTAGGAEQEAAPEVEVPEEEENGVSATEERWKGLADKGELCVYTCLAFKVGGSAKKDQGDDDDAQGTEEFIFTIIQLLSLQIIVPTLMLVHQTRSLSGDLKDLAKESYEYRICGFVLFLYSIWNIYNNAFDECRAEFLEICFRHNLAMSYVWPLVLGEIVNAFAAAVLCLILFTIFCEVTSLPELVINCIAINFIGSVDSEFCNDDLRHYAMDNFHSVMFGKKEGDKEEDETCARQIMEFTLSSLLWVLRTAGTLIIGTILALIFLLAHEEALCMFVPDVPLLCA